MPVLSARRWTSPEARGTMFDVGQGFLAAVARDPGALAIVDGARRLTYAAWADEVRRVAAGLGAPGLG